MAEKVRDEPAMQDSHAKVSIFTKLVFMLHFGDASRLIVRVADVAILKPEMRGSSRIIPVSVMRKMRDDMM